MKKLSAFIAITLLSATTFASDIPSSKLQDYSDSVKQSILATNMHCKSGSHDPLHVMHILNRTTSGSIDTSGSQPLLILNSEFESSVKSITVTTTQDMSSVVSIQYTEYQIEKKAVNIGDLENPNIVYKDVKTPIKTFSCR